MTHHSSNVLSLHYWNIISDCAGSTKDICMPIVLRKRQQLTEEKSCFFEPIYSIDQLLHADCTKATLAHIDSWSPANLRPRLERDCFALGRKSIFPA